MPYFDSSNWFLIEKTTILTNSCCLHVQPTFGYARGSAFGVAAADRRLVVRVAIGLTSRRSVLPRDEPAVGDVFVSSVKGPPATCFGHFGKNI